MAPGKRSMDSDYSYDSYYEDDYEEGISKKKIIIIVAIVIVAVIAIFCVAKGLQSDDTVEEISSGNTVENQMIATYSGYDVLGKIIIDEFDVEQYILDSTEESALEQGVIRLYGGSLNNYGNFCIAGHNKEGVFERLGEMEVGDTFKVVEPDLKETTYKITEMYSSEADDLKCLLQDDSKIEITLITCENASTTRLIVKAEETL